MLRQLWGPAMPALRERALPGTPMQTEKLSGGLVCVVGQEVLCGERNWLKLDWSLNIPRFLSRHSVIHLSFSCTLYMGYCLSGTVNFCSERVQAA